MLFPIYFCLLHLILLYILKGFFSRIIYPSTVNNTISKISIYWKNVGINIETKYYSGSKLVFKYINSVFSEVDKRLEYWTGICSKAQDDLLCKQALSSISLKKFHSQGGSVYALYPNVNMQNAVRFIVALQTISDYLDNLCDRSGIQNQQSFRQLHLSMMEAVDPGSSKNDYYRFYPCRYDNGYLEYLVEECRSCVSALPSYNLVRTKIKTYIQLYSDLQTYKHLNMGLRENRLVTWANKYSEKYPGLFWWEFAAASGSTLGVFVLYAAASDPSLTDKDVQLLDSAYFPWICGLHILLDYYIDSQEDMQMGDLNFTYYYDNLRHCEERLSFFIKQSMTVASKLKFPDFHLTIINGLLSMYLSDPKASSGLNRTASHNLLMLGGAKTRFYYRLCKLLRFAGKL